jgi:formylglycine-generating enzyme required for sulfatase activity
MTHCLTQHIFAPSGILALSTLLAAVLALPASAVTIPTVPVGNAGNAADTTGYGAVGYDYRIGSTEVTNAQYAEFLNAVAATDTYDLFHPYMDPANNSPFLVDGGISRGGSSGSYNYTAVSGREDHPIVWVSYWDAARFANWLDNGQPTGAQDNSTTEDGAYTLTPDGIANNTVLRNPGAQWFIPNEGEWYNAAYHQGNGPSGDYWDYPTQSDTAPTAEAPAGGSNSANFDHAVSDTTAAGTYVSSVSAYGTYDQGGNVWEWNETLFSSNSRGVRGASLVDIPAWLAADTRFGTPPTTEGDLFGFRVATVPEPATLVSAGMGAITLLVIGAWRARRGRRALAGLIGQENQADDARRRGPKEPESVHRHGARRIAGTVSLL